MRLSFSTTKTKTIPTSTSSSLSSVGILIVGLSLGLFSSPALAKSVRQTDISKLCETTDYCDPPEGYQVLDFPVKIKRGEWKDPDTGALLIETEYGLPQEVAGPHSNETRKIIEKSDEYMIHKVYRDVKYEKVRYDCMNQHKWCSFWAATGECQSNRNFMMQTCSPACRACLYHSYEHRCGKQSYDKNQHVWQAGDLTKVMERIVLSHNHSRIWSRPYPEELVPSPWLITVDEFLAPDECDILVQLGREQGFERSMEGQMAKGSPVPVETEHRTSSTAWCHEPCLGHAVTQRILARLQAMTGIPTTHYEHVQILEYQTGQKYALHSDYVQQFSDRHSGPRILTAYLYLNDDFEGGHTQFDMLNVTVQPKKGRLVLWPSVQDQRPFRKESKTHHQALVVEKGVKYGANVWMHARDFQTPYERGCV